MILLALRLVAYLGLASTAGTMLYLYIVGSWYDPVVWIEVSELVALIGYVILGVWLFIVEVRQAR